MNSHKHDHHFPEDLFDLSLRRSLKNWAVRKKPSADLRDQLLVAAAQQEVAKPRPRVSKFYLGWSFFVKSNLNEVAVRSLYGYAIEATSFKTSMAMAIR